ncbi:MAG TPA: DUF4097 family beta strand repeat-containing protein [Vicinamibacterales bacterium]|nr:DUF4097 family beta strand repeat-containing protein [Vicinamibacterales bacterium]
MGKRELLLILGFVAAGTLVYHLTAPASDPNQRSGWSALVDNVRREVRGHSASVEIVKTDTHPIGPGTGEVRLAPGTPEVTVEGEDREDIASELKVWSNGYDDREARSLAEQTVLKFSEAGGSAVFSVTYPEPGRQRATLTLRVPSRLRVHLARATRNQRIAGVAAVEAPDLRGNSSIERIAGRVAVSHRGGDVSIVDVGSLKMTTQGSEARVERVRGEVALQLRSGELRGSALVGPVEVDSTTADLTLDQLEGTRGPIRINAVSGRVRLRGLASEARVDGRNADLEIALVRAAPVTIYSEGEDVEVIPPVGGYTLDASVTDGQLNVADGSIEVEAVEGEQRAAGAIRGGGATLTLRVTRGDLRIRALETAAIAR